MARSFKRIEKDDTFKNLYENQCLSIREIAEKFGITRQAVHLRLLAVGFTKRSPKLISIDRELLQELYISRLMSIDAVCNYLGKGRPVVRRELLRHGLVLRTANKGVLRDKKLNEMEIGESRIIEVGKLRIPYGTLYALAAKRGYTISIRRVNELMVQVTRIS